MSVPFGLYETLIGIVFLIMIPAMLYVARDCFKKYKNKVDGYSAILTSIAVCFMGVYFIVEGINCYIYSNSLMASGLDKEALEYALSHLILPYPTSTFVLYLIPMIFLFMAAYMGKELIEKKFVDEKVIEEKLKVKVDKRDLEVSRKTFHITIIAVIVCYLFLGKIITNSIYNFIVSSTQEAYESGESPIPWQEVNFSQVFSQYAMSRFLIVFIVAIVCILLTFTDFVRLYFYRFYPIKMVTKTYREREKTSLGPHVYFVFGILFVGMFLPAQPAMITIAISGLGDAFATIVGVTFGKHKYKEGSSKTWEGGVGGFVSSFVFGLLSYFLLMTTYGGTILKGILISFAGAAIFLLIDYYSPPLEVSDNILNPLVIGIATYFLYLLPI